MYAKAAVTSARLLVGPGHAVVGTLFAGDVAAKDKIVTVSVQVNRQGLDLSQPADAQTFYTRLQNAAWLVCTHGTRVVDLVPVDPLGVLARRRWEAEMRSAEAPDARSGLFRCWGPPLQDTTACGGGGASAASPALDLAHGTGGTPSRREAELALANTARATLRGGCGGAGGS